MNKVIDVNIRSLLESRSVLCAGSVHAFVGDRVCESVRCLPVCRYVGGGL